MATNLGVLSGVTEKSEALLERTEVKEEQSCFWAKIVEVTHSASGIVSVVAMIFGVYAIKFIPSTDVEIQALWVLPLAWSLMVISLIAFAYILCFVSAR